MITASSSDPTRATEIPNSGPSVWFPTIRANTGVDRFTERLVAALRARGLRADILWLPHRAEFAPWTVRIPQPPPWATIVHINSWLHPRFVPAHIPVVTTVHGCVHDAALAQYKTFGQALYHRYWIKRLEGKALRRAQEITSVSSYTAQRTQDVFGREEPNVVHNWINTKDFPCNKRSHPQSPFTLLFVGNISRRKGADLFPALMQALGPEYQLLYTGLDSDFRSLGTPTSNMVPLGHIRDTETLIRTYHDVDALLLPSRLEGLSLVALEAQACGRPVITVNSSSMSEVVSHRKTGFLCEKDDVRDMVLSIRQLKENPAQWREMCAASRLWVEGRFSENVALDRLLAIYDRASANFGSRSCPIS